MGPDPSLGNPNTDCQYQGFYGIKWDTPNGIPANTPMVYTFTLDGLYADEQVHYSAKAAEFCNLGTITGPSKSCAKMPLVRLQKSCLTPDAFAGGTLQYTIAVNNPGEVALSNINVSDPGATISGTIAGPLTWTAVYGKRPDGRTRWRIAPYVGASFGRGGGFEDRRG